MKNLLLFFLFLIALSACKKDPQILDSKLYPVITPGSYYPVYPGSSWKYLQNDSIIITHTTAPEYMAHSYVIKEIPANKVNKTEREITWSEPVAVPFLNGRAIYGYDKIECNAPPFTPYMCNKWPVLSEKVGDKFTDGWHDVRVYDSNIYYTVFSKTKNANGDSVLTLKGKFKYWGALSYVETVQYTKDIGLTLKCRVDTLKMDTLYKLRLIEYHINKK